MRTNADLTLYNRYIDPITRAAKYQRTVIVSVFWENRKAVNRSKAGDIASDQAAVYIPFARGMNYIRPRAWQALTTKTGRWTLQEGDVIVKGVVADEITTGFTVSDLEAKYDDVLTITSVDTMDYGSQHLRHWQLGAK